MPPDPPHEPPSERELADLAAFADGSLPAERRAQVAARLADSPALAAELERQRAALRAVRGAAVPAPAALRARVEAARRPRKRGRRGALVASGAVVTAAAATALALLLPSGAPRAPSVAQAAGLASRGAQAPPPPRYDEQPALLSAQVEGVRFPRWQQRFGWRASGSRVDRFHGRRATTVYYRGNVRRLAYTIVGGAALPEPDGRRFLQAGTRFRLTSRGTAHVLSWRRKGHTCVVSASGVPVAELLALTSWRAGGRLEY
jgi:hypothetical protein